MVKRPNCASTFQTSVCVSCAGISLAKASAVAKLRVRRWGSILHPHKAMAGCRAMKNPDQQFRLPPREKVSRIQSQKGPGDHRHRNWGPGTGQDVPREAWDPSSYSSFVLVFPGEREGLDHLGLGEVCHPNLMTSPNEQRHDCKSFSSCNPRCPPLPGCTCPARRTAPHSAPPIHPLLSSFPLPPPFFLQLYRADAVPKNREPHRISWLEGPPGQTSACTEAPVQYHRGQSPASGGWDPSRDGELTSPTRPSLPFLGSLDPKKLPPHF